VKIWGETGAIWPKQVVVGENGWKLVASAGNGWWLVKTGDIWGETGGIWPKTGGGGRKRVKFWGGNGRFGRKQVHMWPVCGGRCWCKQPIVTCKY
jgi:hypothetical protein